VAVDHESLGAVELETVARAYRLQIDLQRAMFCALVNGKRGQ